MKNEFAREYAEHLEICKAYDAAKAANDEAAKQAARDAHKALSARIAAKGDVYGMVYDLYESAKERGNEFIDLNGTLWDENVHPFIAGLRALGIEAFTFSSGWSSAVETAWFFLQEGCTLEGLVEINSEHKDFHSDKYEKVHGYLFKVN